MPKTGATQYHVELGLQDKGRVIKWLVVCNNWDLEPLDLLNVLALGCYQLSPEVLIISLLYLVKNLKCTVAQSTKCTNDKVACSIYKCI